MSILPIVFYVSPKRISFFSFLFRSRFIELLQLSIEEDEGTTVATLSTPLARPRRHSRRSPKNIHGANRNGKASVVYGPRSVFLFQPRRETRVCPRLFMKWQQPSNLIPSHSHGVNPVIATARSLRLSLSRYEACQHFTAPVSPLVESSCSLVRATP